jgi:hypothetical protein
MAKPPYRITKENAAEFQKLATTARKRNSEARAIANGKPPPIAADAFPARVLARTQYAMCRLQDHIDTELNHRKCDALQLQQFFTALARASDVEFAYANRPKPGNWRSAPPKTAPGSTTVEPAFTVPPSEPLPTPTPDKPLTTVETPQELTETTPKKSLSTPGTVPTTPPGEGS